MNRLKELRQEKKLSQKELAENIGVHYRTLQNWENGESQIKPEKAQQLADFFGVSVGYLLGFSSEVLRESPQVFLNTERDEKENKRAHLGYDKLITKSGITDMSAFIKKLIQTVDIEKELKELSPIELMKLSRDKNGQEKIAELQIKKVKKTLENTAIALSYLSDKESELLSLFYVLNNQDKETLIKVAKALADNTEID
ncbi:helix-turn-helix domain-containing protein [Streptococcus anginosus]|uniref:helix-turn-helix domain-containing protein n=1 Tax=Streptococcus anginosus TaxID=1328 RepID=UPI0021F8FB79|nr:helix-turn-helix domain-containing protein [Streptococcus anginosus]MCW1022739.1 helix-turn-helix domain-containing protein [Streptococcus anginosus]MCW1037868.1 helix-turn-helix domain-containing protein [Streptococcus anginosus]